MKTKFIKTQNAIIAMFIIALGFTSCKKEECKCSHFDCPKKGCKCTKDSGFGPEYGPPPSCFIIKENNEILYAENTLKPANEESSQNSV
jgi:hypothetical protein